VTLANDQLDAQFL